MTDAILNLNYFRDAVASLVEVGARTTTNYDRIAARYDEFATPTTDPVHDLAEAITGTAKADRIETLSTRALVAQAPPGHRAQVVLRLAKYVDEKLREEYATVARDNYNQLRDTFNALADKFTAATALVDPEAEPVNLLSESDEARHAWMESELLATQLTAMLPALATAARLAGAPLHDGVDDHVLPVVVDAAGLHRRRVWEAWDAAEGRTARWGQIAALGATIAARPLGSIEKYDRPRPMEVRQVRNGIGIIHVDFDPEDELHASA